MTIAHSISDRPHVRLVGRDGEELAAPPARAAHPAAQDAGPTQLSATRPSALEATTPTRALAPSHRRRSRWFEANPGCFARAALAAAAAGVVTSALGVWVLRRLWRSPLVRAARRTWRIARFLARPWRRRARRPATSRAGR